MSNKKLISGLVVSAIFLAVALYFLPYSPRSQTSQKMTAEQAEARVEVYVTAHISELSPEPAVLGGTHFVTNIIFNSIDSGIVEFEDGHEAHVYNFTYAFNPQGDISITSFSVAREQKEYISQELGLRFSYPSNYFVETKNMAIVLTEDTAENRDVREGRAPGREGPVSITIDVYQNNLGQQTAEEWIRSNDNSNFKLSNGVLAPTTVGEHDALTYTWSGLYEATGVVVATDAFIYSFTATYLEPTDQISKDFELVMKTISFI